MAEDILELGTDVSSTWDFTNNGDLVLVSNTDNIYQAMVNRLLCPLDSLVYYDDYGSDVHSYTGERKNEDTLSFLEIEIENRIIQDPRVKDFDVTAYINKDDKVNVDVTISYDDETDLSLTLTLNNNGVEIE